MNQQKTSWILSFIDQQRCIGCGLCARLCSTQAVEVRNALAVIVLPEACTFCDVCESFCPEGAIGRPFTIVFGPAAGGNAPNSTGITQEEHHI